MILKECYTVLGLSEDALLPDVKSAYRRLAFSLHPDLNPDVPDAAQRFQELNEAYVLLSQALAVPGGPRQSEQTARAREEARKAYEKARQQQGEKGDPPPEKSREEILADILHDPFARRVFEDIYSHIRHDDRPRASAGARSRSAAGQKGGAAEKKGSGPVLGGIKSWLRRQIDEEQILRLPGEQIVPGARVRLQIRHGLSGDPQTVELTLPPEFAPGKAMRLKGMGRRLGNWRGDLYVRIEPA
ncbi:MAG: DnaJ domain-containing protein [Desulfovibrio sp.]|jgi:molecular chaperone DnaJ|nr:DnaJ domain-containing protein [Desulfovibrio sp.]